MTLNAVRKSLKYASDIIKEWEDAGFGLPCWREEHTRYAIIDPVIRGLDWKIDWARGLGRGESDAAMSMI